MSSVSARKVLNHKALGCKRPACLENRTRHSNRERVASPGILHREWDWYLDINTVSTTHGHLRMKEMPVLTSIITTQRKKYQFWHMYNNYAEKEIPVLTYTAKAVPVLTYTAKVVPVLMCYHRERVGHLLTSFSTLWWTWSVSYTHLTLPTTCGV